MAQFAAPFAEDKLAGILALSEILIDDPMIEHVPALAQPFQLGHIAEWGTCD